MGRAIQLWTLFCVVSAADASGSESVTFAVIGHLRGDAGRPNYLMGELLEKVRTAKPNFVVLTGDMIYGDTHVEVPDPASVEAEWDALDAWIAALGVPAHRVVGSHDIHDEITRDIYVRRYGDPVQAVSVGRLRLLLMNSTYVPRDGGSGMFGTQRDIGSDQISFIQEQLADEDSYDHAFMFLHHLLWWKPDAAWWRTVHPLLVGTKVRAVFSGEYGPMKFSHINRDGIDYFQSSIESATTSDALEHARHRMASRMLALQFDNFFRVTVDDAHWEVHVETLGEVSSQKFTPQYWHAANEPIASMKWAWVQDIVRRPKRLVAVMVVLVIVFVLGCLASARCARRADVSRA